MIRISHLFWVYSNLPLQLGPVPDPSACSGSMFSLMKDALIIEYLFLCHLFSLLVMLGNLLDFVNKLHPFSFFTIPRSPTKEWDWWINNLERILPNSWGSCNEKMNLLETCGEFSNSSANSSDISISLWLTMRLCQYARHLINSSRVDCVEHLS